MDLIEKLSVEKQNVPMSYSPAEAMAMLNIGIADWTFFDRIDLLPENFVFKDGSRVSKIGARCFYSHNQLIEWHRCVYNRLNGATKSEIDRMKQIARIM